MKKFMKEYGKEIICMALLMVVFLAAPVYATEYAQKVQSEGLSIIGCIMILALAYVAFKCFVKGMAAQAIISIVIGIVILGVMKKPELLSSAGESIINKIFS